MLPVTFSLLIGYNSRNLRIILVPSVVTPISLAICGVSLAPISRALRMRPFFVAIDSMSAIIK